MDILKIDWGHRRKQVYLFIYFCLFRAAPVACGSSQARGLIGTTAAATAMPDPSPICDLHHSSWQHQILNPLSEARDRTSVLMDSSQICFCCAMVGIPISAHLFDCRTLISFYDECSPEVIQKAYIKPQFLLWIWNIMGMCRQSRWPYKPVNEWPLACDYKRQSLSKEISQSRHEG